MVTMVLLCAPSCVPLVGFESWSRNVSLPSTIVSLVMLMLKVLKESGGTAHAVAEEEIIAAVKEIAKTEGLLISPEGAATWKALVDLNRTKKIRSSEKILLLNTGTGYKYMENF